LRVARFHFGGLVHDVLPGARTEGGIAVLEINPREPQIHGGLFAGLVERGREAFGFLPVPGLEALEFAGGGVEGVINALAAKEQAITCFHVLRYRAYVRRSPKRLDYCGLIVPVFGCF